MVEVTLLSVANLPRQLANLICITEKDTYVACAGEIYRKCNAVANELWAHHTNAISWFLSFIRCYDKETETCDAPIAQHMNTVVQALGKHLREKHGQLGGMIKEIDH